MSAKGLKIYLRHRRVLFLHGPRYSGKSWICWDLLIQHAFSNNHAVCAIIVHGLSASVGSGTWDKITGENGRLEREWFNAGVGCEWHTKPTMKGDTKMRWCRIVNQHGSWSEIQIHTLQKSEQIDKFKDSNFTFIYLVEADRWESLQVLQQIRAQLRSDFVPFERRQIVLDANPPLIGTKHWLHKFFLRNAKGQYPPDLDDKIQEVGFKIDDNTFISQAQKDEIRETNSYDPVELARNYHGEWVNSSVGTIFQHQYNRQRHVIGDISSLDTSEHRILMPPRGSYEFPTGWDMGDARNHAMVLGCKVLLRDKEGRPKHAIYFIDELVKINLNSSIREFTYGFMELANYWRHVMSTRGSESLDWRFHSDSASLNYNAAADKSPAQVAYETSKGFVVLGGVKKGAGSVDQRKVFLQRALYDGQIFISARCVNLIEMIESLRSRNGRIDDEDPLKHVFDAATYLLMYELPGFLETNSEPEADGIISI